MTRLKGALGQLVSNATSLVYRRHTSFSGSLLSTNYFYNGSLLAQLEFVASVLVSIFLSSATSHPPAAVKRSIALSSKSVPLPASNCIEEKFLRTSEMH